MSRYEGNRNTKTPIATAAYIIETFSNNPDVKLEDLANETGLHVTSIRYQIGYWFYTRPSETTKILVRQSKIND